MKLTVLVLCLLGMAQAFAQDNAPYGPELSLEIKKLSSFGATQNGLQAMKMARATFDTAVQGGTAGAHGLGVYLPAKAIIKQAWFYTVTQFTKTGTGTVALSCEDANNIYTAADISSISAGAITSGNETGTAANMVASIAAPCEITATVGLVTHAGKLNLFVEYVVGD